MALLLPPDLGRWRAGNTGVEGVWHFDSGHGGPSVLITALIHGNEVCGAWALCDLLEAGVRPEAGRLTLALCNLAAFDRHDAAKPEANRFVDEDLNRVWQAGKLADPSTAERRRAQQLLPFAEQADVLLDLHSMTLPSPPLQLAGMAQRHLALARALGTPAHVVRDAGHADGTRLRDHGRFGLPDGHPDAATSLLIECGQHQDLASRTVAREQCRRLLQAVGSLGADAAERLMPGWTQALPATQWAVAVTDAVTARGERGDLRFTAPVQAMQVIERAGTVFANNAGESVASPYDDCVLIMPGREPIRPGTTAVRLGRRQPLP